MGWIEEFEKAHAGIALKRDVPMRTLTTFGLGGPADAVLFARTEQEIASAGAFMKERQIPLYVMGNGSNLIIRDGGIRGLVIRIGAGMAAVHVTGTSMRAEAGATLTQLGKAALQNGLQGLEWAYGIPGTLGGACAMNAGAYGGSMQQVVTSIRYYENGEITERTVQPHEMGYRESAFTAPERVVLSATLTLQPDDGAAAQRQETYMQQRKEKQPLACKSAGSTFKRPPGHFAGVLIEGAGLKGVRIGGAMVSPKHAGFIINDGTATGADVLGLIALVQEKVNEAYGVQLNTEPRIWGENA